MICKEVKRVVYFFLDGTLGKQREKDFSSHINLCPECGARMTFHRRIRNFLKKRLAPLSAPEHLKLRLSRTLRAFGD
jgi:anti-sigma factor (TIGR02949 family)